MTLDQIITTWLPTPRQKPKILIVDDQPMNVRVLYELFREECDVLMATSGEQAIAVCCAQMPDLILLDVMMPDMSGHDVCKLLKLDANTREIPIIFITGQRTVEDEVAGFQAGAVDFISKPINPVIVSARAHTHLALKMQRDALRSIALIDGLTGLANRRNFDDSLERSWRKCMRENTPIALFMIDIDYFKRFNDHYGHQAGDTCLRAVAQAIKGTLLRPYDLAARYGGEEFVCLLPETDIEGAMGMGQRTIKAVNDLQIPHEKSDAAPIVSISIGIAAIIPDLHTTTTDFVAAADKQLYMAKNNGRNQFSLITALA